MFEHPFERIARELREAIARGDYRPGELIPGQEELARNYGVGRPTVARAIRLLRADGLVTPVRKRGTIVRHPPLQLPLARYTPVLSATSTRGPWEEACARAGVSGETRMLGVEQIPASEKVAEHLQVAAGALVVRRWRHHLADEQVVQIQESVYPLELVEGTPLAEPGKVTPGVYAALIAAGHPPASITERVAARAATTEEVRAMELGSGVPVITVERVTYDAGGRPLELLHVVSAGDRSELVYEGLPLSGPAAA
jgi:GntR family transcriptional regulator